MPRALTKPQLPAELEEKISRAGYYPQLVSAVLRVVLGGEPVNGSYLHVQTTFAEEELRRHLTALVITPTRLISAHVDDHEGDEERPAQAAATTESVPLRDIRTVTLTHLVVEPAEVVDLAKPEAEAEVNMAISWGQATRIDLEPMTCGNPDCEGDHGISGQSLADDLTIRVSAAAEGPAAIASVIEFAQQLSAATAQA